MLLTLEVKLSSRSPPQVPEIWRMGQGTKFRPAEPPLVSRCGGELSQRLTLRKGDSNDPALPVLVRVRSISSGCRLTEDVLTLYLVAPYDLMTASSDF